MPKIKNLIRTADIQSDAAYGILRKGFKLAPFHHAQGALQTFLQSLGALVSKFNLETRVSQSIDFTGQFLLDEAYLRDYHDITDFTIYQMDPSADPKTIREKYFMDRYERRKDSFPEHFQ